MSADNWTVCPKCKIAIEKKQAEHKARVEAVYGKVDAEEYLKQLDEFKKTDYTPPSTLREDYQIGMCDDAVFHVIYKGACSECDFSFTFKTAIPNCDKLK